MKVLWVTNVAPAAASVLLGEPASPFGGWLQGSLSALSQIPELDVSVAFPVMDSVRTLGEVDGLEFFTFPPIGRRTAEKRGHDLAKKVIAAEAPDLLHIHGTELAHSLSFVSAAEVLSVPVVVSIQGLVSVYARHMRAFLPSSVVHGASRRPWVRSDRIVGLQRSFEVQGNLERQVLRSVSHVIGRTTWDRVCTERINARLRYHHCNETLRRSFYSQVWQAENIHPHSILVGQGHYPIKGLHLLLEALPTVVPRFPDTVVTVAGQAPFAGRRTPYARHLDRMIERFQLREHIRFVGPQSEPEMLALYRQANVVVCPSVIENSPNSVAEGMLLGAPVVAAYVGGIPDMLTHGADGLMYQADAPYMLAHSLATLFENPELASELGNRARLRALRRHDPHTNALRTAEIYASVLDRK